MCEPVSISANILEGEYYVTTSSRLVKTDGEIALLVLERKKDTDRKPRHYLMLNYDDQGLQYLSSLSQTEEGVFVFDSMNPHHKLYKFKESVIFELRYISGNKAIIKRLG